MSGQKRQTDRGYGMPRGQRFTVGSLREVLAKLPEDAPVILSEDAEGNRYHPLQQVDLFQKKVLLWPAHTDTDVDSGLQ